MPDSRRTVTIIGVAVLLLVIWIGILPISATALVSVAVYAFAAYWGFVIGRSLHMQDYRNQAFGAGSIALYVVMLIALGLFLPVSAKSDTSLIILSDVLDIGLIGFFLYWVNVTVSIARRSDPYERDNLRYSVTKYVWWLAIAAPVATAFYYDPAILAYFSPNLPLNPTSLPLAVAPFLVFTVFGAALLFVSASRSKDRTLTSHVRWLGATIATSLVVFSITVEIRAAGGLSGPYANLTTPLFYTMVFLAAYGLYRSVKSLAPTTKNL